MAEVIQYRIEKTLEETNLLVEFGLFDESQARDLIKKRENFETVLRRKTKLGYLKYIRFELNFLESLEKYRKAIIKRHKKPSGESDVERKLLLLQAHKLNDIIRSRVAHVNFLFRRATTTFQFDKNLWLAYIDFAKSRGHTTKVPKLYWRLLRVASNDQDVWLAAAEYEVEQKEFNNARGIYLKALRHHPKSIKIWVQYFEMEMLLPNSKDLARVLYDNIATKLDTKNDLCSFVAQITTKIDSKSLLPIKQHMLEDIKTRFNIENVDDYVSQLNPDKKGFNQDTKTPSKLDLLYECYESKGLTETRKLFENLDKSVKNQTLSLYVGMIQVEMWQKPKDRSRVEAIYEKAIAKFGKSKPKLWYEYLQFEHEQAKSLEDFERINQIYTKAQLTLFPPKVDKLVEKYTLLQVNSSSADIEYSDYSDLEN